MKELYENLDSIASWLQSVPDPRRFKGNDAYMRFMLDLMSRCLYLLKVGTALAPDQKTSEKGWSKQRGIIVGHMVRITKLYEGITLHMSKRQAELAAVLFRQLYETAVRMEYIVQSQNRTATIRSFIETSYRPEQRIVAFLTELKKQRPLVNIEKRMMRKIRSRMKRDRLSVKKLMSISNWKLDGKSFYGIAKAVGRESEYTFAFQNSSHFVHGDWYEIAIHHLVREGRYYKPDLEFDDPDPRIACPVTDTALEALLNYLEWSKGDPDGIVTFLSVELRKVNWEINEVHEATLGA